MKADDFYSSIKKLVKGKKSVLLFSVILLVLLAGVLINHNQSQKTSHKQANSAKGFTAEEKYHMLADEGKYEEAEQVLEGELSKANDEQKVAIYFQQSSIAIQFHKNDDAQIYANKALKVDPTSSDTYVGLAQVAIAKGDKNLAKSYWQQAIAHLDKSAPQYNLVLRQYQEELMRIGN